MPKEFINIGRSGLGLLNRHLLFFLICQSNDDVHLLLIDVTDTRND